MDVYTFHKLLQEAKNLSADAIVNVVIEANIEGGTEKLFSRKLRDWVIKKTWYSSAPAIKYTATINDTSEKSVVVLGPDGKILVTDKASSAYTPLAPETGGSGSSGSGASGRKW